MNTKLSQDAHDTLTAYEARQAFISEEKARWARTVAASKPCTGPSWVPTMTEQEHAAREHQIKIGALPF